MSVDTKVIQEFAEDLAKRAGEIVKEGFTNAEKNIDTKTSAIDLVTEYDRKVERFIFGEIKAKFPGHKMIGEESTAESKSGKNDLTDDPTWIVDPIDGTLNFVHSFPFVAISIGVTIGKVPVVGVIFNPLLDHMYTGRRGHGAFYNGKRMKVSGKTDLSSALIFMEIGYSADPEKMACVRGNFDAFLPEIHGLRCLGSAAIQMAMVAQGAADSYSSFGIHCWDMAAGVVLVEEAGGIVCDTEGGPLDLMSRRCLATASRQLADQVVAKLKQFVALPRDD